MAKIKNEAAYRAALRRIDELLPLVHDDTPVDDKNYLELDMISDMVEEYEEAHYPIGKPSLVDVLRLRMYEMGLNQSALAALIGVSPSRVSDFLAGRSEPTMRVGREMNRKLHIDAEVILGV